MVCYCSYTVWRCYFKKGSLCTRTWMQTAAYPIWTFVRHCGYFIKVCQTQSADLSVFVLFFLFFFFIIKVCQTQSADLSVFVLFFLFFYYSFLFFSTATCVLRFLHYFSTNLDEIWHVDSPWWDEQTEYFFKSIGPGVGIRRGPIVLLCFIIGKTLYTVRRDKNFT